MALNTRLSVSQEADMAIFVDGVWFPTMDPNTTMKMMGNNNEKTTEVGLCSVAIKLYFERVSDALSWLDAFISLLDNP